MNEPTWLVEWTDDDPDPEGTTDHAIAGASLADVLSIVAAALDGNAWNVQISQNQTEEFKA